MAHKTNLAKAKEQLARIQKNKDDREAKKGATKLQEGTTELRVAPAYSEAGEWNCSGFFHYGFTDENGPILCPTTYGEECPICVFVAPLWKGTDEDRQQAKDLGRKLRYFINAQMIALKKPDDTVEKLDDSKFRILPITEGIAVEIGNILMDEDYGDITDPKTGRNIRIKREGKGFTTKYGDPLPRPGASEVVNFAELEKTIANLHDYVYKNKKSYEEINKILENGGTPEEVSEGVTDPTETDGRSEETKAKEKADDWGEAPPQSKSEPVKVEKPETRPVKEAAKDESKKVDLKARIARMRQNQGAGK